jgi:hypothetical protein
MAVQQAEKVARPKLGENFRCPQCGMAIQVTADCRCPEEDNVHFRCCNQEMEKVGATGT